MPVQAALERARAAQAIGRLEQARRILGTALANAPDDPRVLVALADIAYDLDQFDDTVRFAGQALQADPDSARAHQLVAMAYPMREEWDLALEHGHTAARLRPHDAGTLLLLAWLYSNGPRKDPDRARAAVVDAVALAPGDAFVHCSAAETYQRLVDIDGVRRHITAGLTIDPLHVDLLRMQARAEFEIGGFDGGRKAAIATLRGLLANAPTDTAARRLLAEMHWRALLRLAAWVWAFAGCFAAVAMWAPPIVLRVISPMMFAALPLAWYGVFRKVRKQLPPGYLRARVRRPRVLLALAAVALSGLIVDMGAIATRSEFAGLVRLGCVLLVLGAFGAAFGHLLLFTAWMRRGLDDPDPDDGLDFALTQIVVLGMGVVPLVVVVAFVRGWARQPAVFGALVAVLGVVLVTLLIEAGITVWVDRRAFRHTWGLAVVALGVLVLLAGAGLAVRWGGGERRRRSARAGIGGGADADDNASPATHDPEPIAADADQAATE
ncbi:tetratricopeptide repeat protein [Nocardia sp. PE-7]|uniref:tetratricopeptide repeat protein n=1 Tax=Nocardia sp. PE-7 TaxID=3058426 RepID=UPI00265A1307|nr:tetratricopeptide repeat protein [Nocardia sp. PE-7]WKG07755.1 tetratricopeptide repeat protein [Nocardia sp. PE-7]